MINYIETFLVIYHECDTQPAITCSNLASFTPCSNVSIVDFEQVNTGWVVSLHFFINLVI